MTLPGGAKPAAIRAVLFDFGGVLAEEGFRDGLHGLAVEQGMDAERLHAAGMQAVYDSGFVLGQGTAADFWALLRDRTGLAGDDSALTARILAGFTLRPWMLEQVQQLRQLGYVTAILSDQTHWLDELDARYGFGAYFDHIFNSYYRGRGKRDPALFTEVAEELGMPQAALLFIDDDPGNVARARQAGYQAIQYVDRQDFHARIGSLLLLH